MIIGDGVTKIGTSAFAICKSLTSITIGKKVKKIENHTFENAPILECYSYSDIPPTIVDQPFNAIRPEAVLYVPTGSGKEYKSKWGRFFDNIVEIKK